MLNDDGANNFNVRATSLNVLHNYFDDPNKSYKSDQIQI